MDVVGRGFGATSVDSRERARAHSQIQYDTVGIRLFTGNASKGPGEDLCSPRCTCCRARFGIIAQTCSTAPARIPFGMHPGRSRTLRVSTSLGLIKIHKQAKSRSVCSSQRNIDFPALRSWMRSSECWTRGQIPRLTSNPSVEPLSLRRG